MSEFTLDEAVTLIYRHVVLKKNVASHNERPQLSNIGHVCGVLTLNEQIEIVVKFQDELRQFSKLEFQSELAILQS
ncbi:hypothetical protein SAMN02745130_03714 [Thiothrix eikelboomii]|uniref:DUF4926 domain-containing protein n=1 Tax=Thiothrix eikelboomii TaxID=92487 RepID=A0A1T4Y155_9GAMM|nr:hypothetical protein [Thiothrix eikelboomii]SKA94995.1 hypothetical protein SAMN02745130_03714 [Thiothrix eikelboomii]